MAVLGFGLFLLVVMPGLIYFSLAVVLRSARLARGRERRGGVVPARAAEVEEPVG